MTRQTHALMLCALGAPLLAALGSSSGTSGRVPQDTAEPPAPRPLTLRKSGTTPQTSSSPAATQPAPAHQSSPAAGSDSQSNAETHPKPVIPSFASSTINRTTVVLDPAHGGIDNGSRIGDSIQEKDVTLAFAFKLRSLLSARGFNVVMTRDADQASEPSPSGGTLTLDDRAGIANHARGVACLLLHATGSGTGAHLYSSELAPTPGQPSLLPWLTAQAAWVRQSQALESSLASALTRAQVPLVMSAASVRPVDSLNCPALVIELAPRTSSASSINDDDYQQRVAQAIAGVLVFWQNQAVAPPRLPTPSTPSVPHHTTAATTTTGGLATP